VAFTSIPSAALICLYRKKLLTLPNAVPLLVLALGSALLAVIRAATSNRVARPASGADVVQFQLGGRLSRHLSNVDPAPEQ